MTNIKHIDHNIDSDYGLITTDELKVNKKSKPRVWIEDNFYEDPDAVREYALSQTFYDQGHGGVGWRTRKQFIFDGVKEKFEQVMQRKISKWNETYDICGVFQSAFCTDDVPPLVYHADGQQWAAMIYLTPNAPFETGTKIVANKESKKYHLEQCENESYSDIFPNQETFCDGTLFENVDVLGNVYNRLVIFDGRLIHSSCGYFGSNFTNGRLWQMFFFDTKEK
tara:strand:- start:676 stop:1347 length:672 start_codon:yes stop_codon:yes gene_type:complete